MGVGRASRGGRSWVVGGMLLALRAALLLGVTAGATPVEPSNQLSFGDVLNILDQSDHGNNWEASVDFLRHEGSPRTTCRSRGLCKCFSKLTRRAFCCDCLGGPCFPGDSTVLTPSGAMPLDRLSVGDLVLAGDDNGVVWSPVVAWLDRRPNVEAQYLTLATSAGPQLTLSSSHVLLDAKGPQLTSKFAGDVKVGDAVAALDGGDIMDPSSPFPVSESLSCDDLSENDKSRRILATNVTEVIPVIKKGAFVPLTKSGTIFVDGVLASCYASVTHDLAHAALSPVRWAPEWVVGGQREGTMPFVSLLKWVARWLVPSHLCAPKDTSVAVVLPLDDVVPPLASMSGILNGLSNAVQLMITSV
ncbi:tiggy-winkle hedgehog protein-like [Penaeus japonicus]|uniref:tiggy-winkle hedgehog protein-like n=1 Tax=Penaeus japonicus TaxID=27405 RepID=UPI001C70EA10|nr:tiggy-winkle hedgehog protein-like [Penaeus japonicus]